MPVQPTVGLFRGPTGLLLLAMLFLALAPGRAAGQEPSEAYFEFLMARHLEALGDARGARAALERAAVADPDSAEVQAEIASFHWRRDERGEAEKAARAALGLDERNLEANRVLGQIYAAYAEGERMGSPQAASYLQNAITHLERVVTLSATADINIHYTLGRLYMATGDADKAIQSLERVVGQNPTSVQGRLALAEAYAAAGDAKSAIGALADVIDAQPRVAGALGRYLEQTGLFVEAADAYTRALTVQPTNVDLKLSRIRVLYNAKEFARAAAAAADARRQHPDDLRFTRLHARALFDAGDRDEAIALLETTARAFPRDNDTQFALVDLYSGRGRDGDAERVLRQILATEPSNPNALNYLGYMLAVRGEHLDEAIALVRRALEADPDNGAYLDSLGWAYFRRGDLDEAEKYLTAAAARLPRNSEVLDHLGDLHASRDRWDAAIRAWTRAIEGDGEDVDRAVIQQKIDDARTRLPR